METLNIIERFSRPTRFDMAPYGTLIKYVNNEKTEFWLQTEESNDHGTAQWEELGAVLLKVFMPCVLKKDFITECLYITSGQKTLSKSNLKKIIGELKDDENILSNP